MSLWDVGSTICQDGESGKNYSGSTLSFAGTYNLSGASNQLSITPGSHKFTITASNPAQNSVITIPDVTLSTMTLAYLEGTQTISGSKTFSSQAIFSASSNQIQINPGAHNFVITAASPASNVTLTIPDPGVSSDSIALLTPAQTFVGIQTFNSGPILAAASAQLTIQKSGSGFKYIHSVLANPAADRTITYYDPGANCNLKFGLDQSAIITSDPTPSVADSGKVYYINSSGGTFNITLPTLTLGLIYTFVWKTGGNNVSIVGTSGTVILQAIANDATAVVVNGGNTQFNFITANSTSGDVLRIRSDAAKWYGEGSIKVHTGLTTS